MSSCYSICKHLSSKQDERWTTSFKLTELYTFICTAVGGGAATHACDRIMYFHIHIASAHICDINIIHVIRQFIYIAQCIRLRSMCIYCNLMEAGAWQNKSPYVGNTAVHPHTHTSVWKGFSTYLLGILNLHSSLLPRSIKGSLVRFTVAVGGNTGQFQDCIRFPLWEEYSG